MQSARNGKEAFPNNLEQKMTTNVQPGILNESYSHKIRANQSYQDNDTLPINIMADPRVVRGNTYAKMPIITGYGAIPYNLELKEHYDAK